MHSKNSPVIISRVFGGIGNQLFIYAASRRLAEKNNAELVLDTTSGFKYDYEYKRHYQLSHFNIKARNANKFESLEPFSKARRFFKRKINSLKPFSKRNYIHHNSSTFDNRLLDLNVAKNKTLYLEGYWQHHNYFSDIENIIRKELSIKPPDDNLNIRLAEEINTNISVAIHVRFFNEPGSDKDISGDYYKKSIQMIENKFHNARYYLFSDRPKEAIKKLNIPSNKISIIDNNHGDVNAYADLWLMSQCNHFIIANSTFSWWGAWLSNYSKKIVIAPDYKKSDGQISVDFDNMILDNWIKC